jgi:DNA-binding transcriptional regulator YhcF (GntR family)
VILGHEKNDTDAKKNCERIKNQIEKNAYKGGLEAEVEKPTVDTERKYVHHFAGHEIHTMKDFSNIYTTTLNVNKEAIRNGEPQLKKRYPHNDTYINTHSKHGNIIGSIHRIREQNTFREHFTESIIDFINELRSIGYKKHTVKKCFYKLARQDKWAVMLKDSIRELSQQNWPTATSTAKQTNRNSTHTTPSKQEMKTQHNEHENGDNSSKWQGGRRYTHTHTHTHTPTHTHTADASIHTGKEYASQTPNPEQTRRKTRVRNLGPIFTKNISN